MLAASASIWASLCGVFRAFRGDFLSLFSGTKISVPLCVTVSVFAFVVIVFSYGLGLERSAALQPCPSARPG